VSGGETSVKKDQGENADTRRDRTISIRREGGIIEKTRRRKGRKNGEEITITSLQKKGEGHGRETTTQSIKNL